MEISFKKIIGFCSFLLLAFLFTPGKIAAQKRIGTIDSLLYDIEVAQKQDSGFFFKGSFPSYRRYGWGEKLKPDNNIYFTGLIVFTLRRLEPFLTDHQKEICEQIRKRAEVAFPHFQRYENVPVYNFWRVDPPVVFPNSGFLTQFNEVNALPDDLDDTAILWLCQDPSEKILRQLKKLMDDRANNVHRQIKNIYRKYRTIPAYTTWFGTKTPLEFDFCVLCNALYLVYHYDMKQDVHDTATVHLLRNFIKDGSLVQHPGYISSNYGRTPLLLYHISRLMGRFSIPALDSLKPVLLKETQLQYRQADCWLDSLLLSTASIWLGGKSLPVSPPNEIALWQTRETFFVASLATICPNLIKRWFVPFNGLKYYFVCSTYRKALYLENKVLRRNAIALRNLKNGVNTAFSEGFR